jgi:hypothetical protein
MIAHHRSPAARVQACRTEIAGQVQAYRDLVGAASKASGMSLTRIDAALAAFEPAFFNNLLIALDARFARRPRNGDGMDGDPLDEVGLLCASLTANGGVLARDPAIAYEPSRAVLRLDVGERIALNADDFEAIAAAFLDAIEQRLAAG